jgi:hypothetical protein
MTIETNQLNGFFKRIILKIKCDSFEDGPHQKTIVYHNVHATTIKQGGWFLVTLNERVQFWGWQILSVEAR